MSNAAQIEPGAGEQVRVSCLAWRSRKTRNRNKSGSTHPFWRISPVVVPGCVAAALLATLLIPAARAQDAIDPEAQDVLSGMSTYLGSLQAFSVDFEVVDEIVSKNGEKLQFLSSGVVTVQRPNMLQVSRRGAAGDAELFLDGDSLVIEASAANAYFQLEASSIDAAVDALHELGFDAPGADLLVSSPLDSETTDLESGTHVGMTFIDGVEVHHLAFRGEQVDWQLWVEADSTPLPLRYVVTTKWFTGAPQYSLELSGWNTSPTTDTAKFEFVPPTGATELDSGSVQINEIGEIVIQGK
jgi:hypothetical protein